jgi:hypothetical protein
MLDRFDTEGLVAETKSCSVKTTITTARTKGDHLQEIRIQYREINVRANTFFPAGFEKTVLFSKGN